MQQFSVRCAEASIVVHLGSVLTNARSQVTQVITTMEQGKILYETTVQSVFDRMRYHNVPSALQERVGMFYKVCWFVLLLHMSL